MEMETASQQTQIEELKAQVRWLEEEREGISWLFEVVPVGYVLMDENGYVREFNPELEKMLGFKRGVLGRGPLARLIFQPDVSAFVEHLRRCKNSNEVVTTEVRMRSGRTRGLPVEIASLPPRQGGISPGLYRTAVIDLTRRRATERKLADAMQSFRTLLDTVEGIVWELDGESLE